MSVGPNAPGPARSAGREGIGPPAEIGTVRPAVTVPPMAFPHDRTILAPHGMVCTVDHLASSAGVAVLRAGGSAADAKRDEKVVDAEYTEVDEKK